MRYCIAMLSLLAIAACQGPIGPEGPQGDPGVQGDEGPQGPRGDAGVSAQLWQDVSALPDQGPCQEDGTYKVEFTRTSAGQAECPDINDFPYTVSTSAPVPQLQDNVDAGVATTNPCQDTWYGLADKCQWLHVQTCNLSETFPDGSPYAAEVTVRETRDDTAGSGTLVKQITWSQNGQPFDGCSSTWSELVVKLP